MDGSRAWRDWGAVKYPENVLRMSLWTDVAFSHIGLKTYALFSKVELASPAAPGGCARGTPPLHPPRGCEDALSWKARTHLLVSC